MLPNPYILLAAGAAFLIAITGAYLTGDYKGTHSERLKWEASTAQLKVDAATMLAASERRKADADNANIIMTLELQERYGSLIADLEGKRSYYTGLYSDSLRRFAARCGNSGGNAVPGEAGNPGGAKNTAGGSGDRLLESAGRDFSSLGVSANKLAVRVRQCVEWAAVVGR